MQIVIDIPEEKDLRDKAIWHDVSDFDTEDIATIITAIANGTPLPKGHGRVIDYGYVVDAIDDWVNAEEYRYTNATDYLRKRVANTPTIIEADTESEVLNADNN